MPRAIDAWLSVRVRGDSPMPQKLYFLANDNGMLNSTDLWVTDGTTTEPVGGLDDMLVSGVGDSGLGPSGLTVFGQQMIFAGSDALNTGSANGLWLIDGTTGKTTEVGGVSPGTQPGAPAPEIKDS